MANSPNLGYGAISQPPISVPSSVQQGKPSKRQFNLFQSSSQPREILLDLWMPIKLFTFPVVDFASFVVSWSASSFLTVNLTQSQAFAAPPYDYTPQTIGFFNFAVVIGQILGLVTAGPLSDWISMRATKRNNGIREPEMRLPAMIPYTLVMILGNFVVGFGYQYHWDWKVRFLPNKHSDQPLTFSISGKPRAQRGIYSHPIVLTSITTSGHRNHRIHMCRRPSCIASSHSVHLRNRLLQAGSRIHICQYHRGQEPLGLRPLKIHPNMEYCERFCSPGHDEHVFDSPVVPLWYSILVQREGLQVLDESIQSPQYVKDRQSLYARSIFVLHCRHGTPTSRSQNNKYFGLLRKMASTTNARSLGTNALSGWLRSINLSEPITCVTDKVHIHVIKLENSMFSTYV